MTLRELITKILQKAGKPLDAKKIAAAVNRAGKHWKDGSLVGEEDVLDRADKYPHIFERHGNVLSLHEDTRLPEPPGGIVDVFNMANRWRNFPGYRMEPRVELFFATYLHGLMQDFVDTPVAEGIIPALPLQQESNSELVETVDFTLFAQDMSKMWLVDLKTDMAPRNKYRDAFLHSKAKAGFQVIMQGIKALAELCGPTGAPRYYYLLHALSEVGALELPRALRSRMEVAKSSEFVANWRVLYAQVRVADKQPDVEIIRIQPWPEKDEHSTVIDFDQVMAYVQHFSDDMSRLFLKSLQLWKTEEGAISPNDTRLEL